MVRLLILLSLACLQVQQINGDVPCPTTGYIAFVGKENLSPEKIISNPYISPTTEYLARVQENLVNKDRVCALMYQDSHKQTYVLKEFNTGDQAQKSGWIVTHQGVCGQCSSTHDLYVYLTTDLTRTVRKCGVENFSSHNKLWWCIKSLGFTDACTQVWFWNTVETKKQCGLVCMKAYLLNTPFVIDGHLNKCLQCDQDTSGPIFKYESGRSRRNSGIKSQIDRPSDQIYNLTHCYY